MWVLMSILLLLVFTVPGRAGHTTGADDGQIVPGERIGAARLGMTQTDIEALNEATPCPVTATYDASGSARRLVTSWGGGCRVSDHVQVGMRFAPALDVFGNPDEVTEDARYADATAYWATYSAWGIGFRILAGEGGLTMIQAIAVFRGTAVTAARRHRPRAESWK